MSRVIHFEIHAENPERAIQFYSTLFQWQFTKWEGPMEYWLIKTGEDSTPGINGGLVMRQGAIDGQAVIAFVCTIDVTSVDQFVQKITANGGSNITMAALTALGRGPELRIHMRGALNLGITKEEIKELIIHLSQYSGVPTAVEAMRVYREVTEPKKS